MGIRWDFVFWFQYIQSIFVDAALLTGVTCNLYWRTGSITWLIMYRVIWPGLNFVRTQYIKEFSFFRVSLIVGCVSLFIVSQQPRKRCMEELGGKSVIWV